VPNRIGSKSVDETVFLAGFPSASETAARRIRGALGINELEATLRGAT
jgi:hypothetical protein